MTGNVSVAGADTAILDPAGNEDNWSVTVDNGITVQGRSGVFLNGAGTVTNDGGTITSVGGSNDIETIANFTSGGVAYFGGGSLINQAGGAISGFVGVLGQGNPVTVNNSGSITGTPTAGDPFIESGAGIAIFGSGSITNTATGTITGI